MCTTMVGWGDGLNWQPRQNYQVPFKKCTILDATIKYYKIMQNGEDLLTTVLQPILRAVS